MFGSRPTKSRATVALPPLSSSITVSPCEALVALLEGRSSIGCSPTAYQPPISRTICHWF